MLTREEVKELRDQGYFGNGKIVIVRKQGEIFDCILPGEEAQEGEIVTLENLDEVLKELD